MPVPGISFPCRRLNMPKNELAAGRIDADAVVPHREEPPFRGSRGGNVDSSAASPLYLIELAIRFWTSCVSMTSLPTADRQWNRMSR